LARSVHGAAARAKRALAGLGVYHGLNPAMGWLSIAVVVAGLATLFT
jgi:hypothetical protein